MSPRTNLHVAGHQGVRLPATPPPRRSPRRRRTLHRRGLEKSAHPGTQPLSGEVRKMAKNAPKKAPKPLQYRHRALSMTESEAPPVLSARTGMSSDPVGERHCSTVWTTGNCRAQPASTTLFKDCTVESPFCGTTGMSGTLSRN